MAHLTTKSAYHQLQQRLEKNPIGAPANKHLFAILEELFTPDECRLAATMPMQLSSAERIARVAKQPAARVEQTLKVLVTKGLVVDMTHPNGTVLYALNPPMVGFFEFTMMRVRDEIDQKKVARDIWNYIHDDPTDGFMKMVSEGETFFARPVVHEDALEPDVHAEVLDFEKASQIIEDAGAYAVGLCHCRHIQQHLDNACDAPLETCLTLGPAAGYVTRAGFAKPIDKARALGIMVQSREGNLVQMADNVKNKPLFICNCCKCCCEMMIGFRNFPEKGNLVTSNYVARIDDDTCIGCGKCAKVCPVDAIHLHPAQPSQQAPKRKKSAVVDAQMCIGCGVCHRQCSSKALRIEFAGARIHTPKDIFEKTLRQALEHGKLQNLVFDDPNRLTHRALGTLLGGLLKLPPAKQLLAREQLRSRFIDFLLENQPQKPPKEFA